MNEILPAGSGIILGVLLNLVPGSVRFRVGAPSVVIFGLISTIVSGEWVVSWSFLLIDIPIVASATAIGLAMARQVQNLLRVTRSLTPSSFLIRLGHHGLEKTCGAANSTAVAVVMLVSRADLPAVPMSCHQRLSRPLVPLILRGTQPGLPWELVDVLTQDLRRPR